MKTINELQAARERELSADQMIISAQDANQHVSYLYERGRNPHVFPISGDALQRARYYEAQA